MHTPLWLRLGFAILSFSVATWVNVLTPAQACMGPHQRVFPACSIATPRDGERTTVIYANSGKGLASASLGGDTIVTEVVDIEIAPADKPHNIVLSSGKAVIWRFLGRVDLVSQVIGLGSQFEGSKVIGIIGIPRDRIVFPAIDENALKTVPQTSCSSIYAACEASAYFNVPNAARMHLAGASPASRFHVDQFVEMSKADTIRIPEAGWIEAEKQSSVPEGAEGWVWPTGAAAGRYEPFIKTGYQETSQFYEKGVIQVDPASVISPVDVKPYNILPGRKGLEQLVSLGTLIKADDPRFKTIYDKWNLKISKPYRSRLDPEFLFSYRIDYLIVRQAALPAAVYEATFLVAENVVPPKRLHNGFITCLYFVNPQDRQPNSADFASPKCEGPLPPGRWQHDHSLARSKSKLDRIRGAAQSKKTACRGSHIDAGSWFAGVALSEGRDYRPNAVDLSERQIDVLVKRPGKVALYLEMDGAQTNWSILPSPRTEITNIVLGDLATQNRTRIDGVPPSVPIQSLLDSSTHSDCYVFNPGQYAHLGGPAVQALNESLRVLIGQKLHSITRATNDGSWPPNNVNADATKVSVVIE
jgi:hypothetical protein